jgi:hypothetical protein
MLMIHTSGSDGTVYDFILTLFLRVSQSTEYLQGYCTLGSNASVLVNFGDEKTMEWRDGRFSAVLRHVSQRYRAVFLSVSGAKPGNRIAINVASKKGTGKVNWSLGPSFSQSRGIKMPESDSPTPISSISYGNNDIVFQTGQAQSTSLDFSLTAYITWLPSDLEFIYLQYSGNEGISVKAQVGSSQPQLLSQTSTLFTL